MDIHVKNKNQLKLGDILLNARKITQDHLEEAMEKQRVFKRKIGEILIMMGLLNPEELELYLWYQKAFQNPEIHDFRIDTDFVQKAIAGELLFKKKR